MPLIIAPDDGYDSLVTLAEAEDYMVKYGHVWPAEEPKQEVALRRATQYILGQYAVDGKYLDPVAAKVKDACCEAAWRAAKGELFKDSDGRIMTERTVDVITTKWAEGQQGGQMRITVIDALLRGMTAGGSMNIKLVRG
ncbi:MAG: hypothetical protein LBJ15_19625 [Comamonas sp.]|jgi:hypothetical protein|uniref:DnaT-like ssDNA-binding protein n=1 Tax=Comamonas sp. TaxID=34028 RepID=UPI00283602EC|nr:DnaT-like ssDNA-binding protein [Comamonas sp.]MDR0216186.1 hypothetical protein [Comamonas sp.]